MGNILSGLRANSSLKRAKALTVIVLAYILAYLAGIAAACLFSSANVIIRVLVFDIVATVVIFACSVLKDNSSVYDPYWSVTPVIVALWLFIQAGALSVMHILFLAAFCLWGVRLTANWCTVFTGFGYEDWRYAMLRKKSGGRISWFIVNLFGIHIVPTLCVFAAMLPVFAIAECRLSYWSIFGILIMLGGTALEFFADRQMHEFLGDTAAYEEKTTCRYGLWNYSRHPNYLGENLFWFGVFVTMLLSDSSHWLYGIGFVIIRILFEAVSIPMAERHNMERREDYAGYRCCTSRFWLLP